MRPLSSPRSIGTARFILGPLALCAALALAGCGGGGSVLTAADETPAETSDGAGASGGPDATTASAAASFPTGLAVAAPGDLGAGTVTVSRAPATGIRLALDWGRAAWAALQRGDTRELARLASLATPFGHAHAGEGGAPELSEHASKIEKVLAGDAAVPLAGVLDLAALFGSGDGNAECYGPSVAYANHQDGGGTASGQLPSGDLGLWLASEADGRPCAVAQMSQRVKGVKRQTLQALLLAAAMRHTVSSDASLAMPAAGATTDLTAAFATRLAAVPATAGVTVETATIAVDIDGLFTYRLVLSNGASGAGSRRGEVILGHQPGAGDDEYNGTLQVAGFSLESDAAFGCTDETDTATGLFKVARVSTVRYSRDGGAIAFGARASMYCGHPVAGSGSDDAAQVAAFTAAGELDPAVKLTGVNRGGVPGWRGNFTRYAGEFDKDTLDGSFLMAWQAGTGDSHSRALAARSSLNTATGERTLDGYFGFAADVAATTGALQGMICNWAGPGNDHNPRASFQSQSATLSGGTWTLGTSRIAYAPTRSCSSTTTAFDVDANRTLDAGEGVGLVSDLDGPSGASTTVDEELTTRGYRKPTLF